MSEPSDPSEPAMFVRVMIKGSYYDIAIDEIAAIEVPTHPQQQEIKMIVGGLHATIGGHAYQTVHQAWVAGRRASKGR